MLSEPQVCVCVCVTYDFSSVCELQKVSCTVCIILQFERLAMCRLQNCRSCSQSLSCFVSNHQCVHIFLKDKTKTKKHTHLHFIICYLNMAICACPMFCQCIIYQVFQWLYLSHVSTMFRQIELSTFILYENFKLQIKWN